MMVFSFIFIPRVKAENVEDNLLIDASKEEFSDFIPFVTDESTTKFRGTVTKEQVKAVYDALNYDIETYDKFLIVLTKGSKVIENLVLYNSNDSISYYTEVNQFGSNVLNFNKKVKIVGYFLENPTNVEDKDFIVVAGGDNLIAYREFDSSILESKPKSYTFNEDIVVTDLSKIKVQFKLPSNTSNLAIDFKYKISQLGFGVGTLGDPYVSLKSIENNIEKTSINSFKSYRNRDHLIEEMKNCVSNYYNSIGATHDGSKSFDTLISKLNSISRYDDHKNLEIESAIKSVFVENDELFVTLYPLALRYVDQDYCSGTYVVSLLPDSTVYEYTFEVDVYNYEGSINLNFTSNLNYEIDYEYKSDLNNFLTTINMDNYSALILIPKVKNLESGSLSSISSDVYLSGIYDINLLEDIDSKNVLYHHSDYDYSVFSHYQDYHYLNATLLFVKKSFGSVNNTITFDSRYYSYVTKFNLSDEVTINNPNTGEDIIIGDISDFYDYGLDNKKFTFNSFLKPIKFVFESITNFYKNYCPELVQNFFYLIFVFFVVLVLIRIFL